MLKAPRSTLTPTTIVLYVRNIITTTAHIKNDRHETTSSSSALCTSSFIFAVHFETRACDATHATASLLIASGFKAVWCGHGHSTSRSTE